MQMWTLAAPLVGDQLEGTTLTTVRCPAFSLRGAMLCYSFRFRVALNGLTTPLVTLLTEILKSMLLDEWSCLWCLAYSGIPCRK